MKLHHGRKDRKVLSNLSQLGKSLAFDLTSYFIFFDNRMIENINKTIKQIQEIKFKDNTYPTKSEYKKYVFDSNIISSGAVKGVALCYENATHHLRSDEISKQLNRLASILIEELKTKSNIDIEDYIK